MTKYANSSIPTPKVVNEGGAVTYTLVLHNNPGSGNYAFPTAVVDTLPDNFVWDGNTPTVSCDAGGSTATISSGTSYDPVTNQLTIPMTGSIKNSKSCYVTFTVNAYEAGTLIENEQITWYMGYGGTSGPGTPQSKTFNGTPICNPGCSPTPVIQAYVNVTPAAVTIVKSASSTTLNGDGTITFTISATNTSGTSSFSLSSLVDTLPNNFTYISGSSSISGVPVGDPTVSSVSSTQQKLTYNLTGLSLAAGASGSLTFRAAVGASAGTYANQSVLSGTRGGTSYSVRDTVDVTITSASSQLWGRSLAPHLQGGQTLPTLNNAARGYDGAFNNSYADSTSDNWAQEGATTNDGFVWSTMDDTTFTTVTSAVALIRFSANSSYVNDLFEWQICVQATCDTTESGATHNDWKKVRLFGATGSGGDELPSTGTPPGSLRTYAVDVSSIVTSAALANRAQMRLIGMGAVGAGESFVVYLDEVQLILGGS